MDEQTPEPPGVVTGLTYEERVDEFIRLLAEGNRVRQAAAAVSINFSTMYRRRHSDPAFAKRWEDALRVPVEKLEAEGLRRAMLGSDRLLMFMLTNLAPEKYSNRQDVTHQGGVALQVVSGVPASQVDDLV
jgi:hypothetical protein